MKSYTQVIDDLTYINYKVQREDNPKVDPKKWELVYGKKTAQAMEKKYQAELKGSK
jgi:hypothetical protein